MSSPQFSTDPGSLAQALKGDHGDIGRFPVAMGSLDVLEVKYVPLLLQSIHRDSLKGLSMVLKEPVTPLGFGGEVTTVTASGFKMKSMVAFRPPGFIRWVRRGNGKGD